MFLNLMRTFFGFSSFFSFFFPSFLFSFFTAAFLCAAEPVFFFFGVCEDSLYIYRCGAEKVLGENKRREQQ